MFFFLVSYRMLLHMNNFPTLWWSELKLSTQLATGVLIWFSIVVLVMIGWCLIIDAWIVNLSRCNLVPMFLNNGSKKLEKKSCGGYMPSDFFFKLANITRVYKNVIYYSKYNWSTSQITGEAYPTVSLLQPHWVHVWSISHMLPLTFPS